MINAVLAAEWAHGQSSSPPSTTLCATHHKKVDFAVIAASCPCSVATSTRDHAQTRTHMAQKPVNWACRAGLGHIMVVKSLFMVMARILVADRTPQERGIPRHVHVVCGVLAGLQHENTT